MLVSIFPILAAGILHILQSWELSRVKCLAIYLTQKISAKVNYGGKVEDFFGFSCFLVWFFLGWIFKYLKYFLKPQYTPFDAQVVLQELCSCDAGLPHDIKKVISHFSSTMGTLKWQMYYELYFLYQNIRGLCGTGCINTVSFSSSAGCLGESFQI